VCYRFAGRIHVGLPKTAASVRTITRLDPGLVGVLLAHRGAVPKRDLVFAQPTGEPLHAQNLWRRDFRRTCRVAGAPRIRFHDLRHVFATEALGAGVPLTDLSAMLGHSSPRITLQLYAHALPAA
jgi:integrase